MKSIESWVAWAAAVFFVIMQHKEKPWLARVAIAGVSGALGYGLAPGLVGVRPWFGEAMAYAFVTALAYAFLDTAFAILSDKEGIRAAMMSALARRSGKGGG